MHIPPSLYSAMRFNFLYVDRYVFHKGWVYPETYVPYCMLRYILKGSAVFTINGVEYQVRENQWRIFRMAVCWSAMRWGMILSSSAFALPLLCALTTTTSWRSFSISRRSPKTPSKRSFPIFRRSLQRHQQKRQPVYSASGEIWSLSGLAGRADPGGRVGGERGS